MTKLSEENIQQMTRFIRDIADGGFSLEAYQQEANTILALIERPKTDKEWAWKLIGERGNSWFDVTVLAITKGRELQSQELPQIKNHDPDRIRHWIEDGVVHFAFKDDL